MHFELKPFCNAFVLLFLHRNEEGGEGGPLILAICRDIHSILSLMMATLQYISYISASGKVRMPLVYIVKADNPTKFVAKKKFFLGLFVIVFSFAYSQDAFDKKNRLNISIFF